MISHDHRKSEMFDDKLGFCFGTFHQQKPQWKRYFPFLLANTKMVIFQSFDTHKLPEGDILGIRSFFRGLSFEQQARPWRGAWEPNIEVSGTESKNIFNHRLV